jgi:hypothetical protein
MRSSLLNLALGIVRSGLWLYRALFILRPDGLFGVALTELAIVLPLGIGGILDWVQNGRRGGKAFVYQADWSICDFFFFATGALGALVLLLSPFLGWVEGELALMGALAGAVGAVHYVRRRVYMAKARAERSSGP